MVPFKLQASFATFNLSAATSSALIDCRGFNRIELPVQWTTAASGYFQFKAHYESVAGSKSCILTPPAGSVHIDPASAASVTLSSTKVILAAAAAGSFVAIFTELPPWLQLLWTQTGGGANDCNVGLYLASQPNGGQG
jgi:hypothetical protein